MSYDWKFVVDGDEVTEWFDEARKKAQETEKATDDLQKSFDGISQTAQLSAEAISEYKEELEYLGDATTLTKEQIAELKEELDYTDESLAKTGETAEKSAVSFKTLTVAFGALTAGLVAGAVALDSYHSVVRDQSRMQAAFDQTEQSTYDMVLSISNAVDSQEEMGKTMFYLLRSGTTWGEQLRDQAKSMDALGDAVGLSSDVMAETLLPTYKALGVATEDQIVLNDKLAYSVNTTLLNVSEWSYLMRYMGESLEQFGIDPTGSMALMSTFGSYGVQMRKMRMELGQSITEQADANKEIIKAKEKILDIQERINAVEKTSATNAKYYAEDMAMAGNDVSKMRDLTIAYTRKKAEDAERIAELEKQKIPLQTIADTPVKEVDLIANLDKLHPGFAALYAEHLAKLNNPNLVTGAAEKIGAGADKPLAKEQFMWDMKMLSQGTGRAASDALGEGADAAAVSAYYAAAAAGTLTSIFGLLSIWDGLGIAGGKGGSALGGLGDVAEIAGLGVTLGGGGAGAAGTTGLAAIAAPLAVLVAGILGTTIVASAVSDQMRAQQDALASEWRSSYMSSHPGASKAQLESAYYDARYEANANQEYPADMNDVMSKPLGYVGKYADGGIVPGAPGQAVNATVHGGEVIVPYKDVASTFGGNFGKYGDADPIAAIVEAITSAASGLSLTIQNVNLSKDYPLQSFVSDAARMARDRKQMGIRTT